MPGSDHQVRPVLMLRVAGDRQRDSQTQLLWQFAAEPQVADCSRGLLYDFCEFPAGIPSVLRAQRVFVPAPHSSSSEQLLTARSSPTGAG